MTKKANNVYRAVDALIGLTKSCGFEPNLDKYTVSKHDQEIHPLRERLKPVLVWYKNMLHC